MLYRRSRDIHVQLPPEAFSVSLNILGSDPAQPWIDQYRFDISSGTFAEALTCTAAEALLTLAAQFGGEGSELARDFARRHPCDRMRLTAVTNMACAASGSGAAADSSSGLVAGHARQRLAAMEALQRRSAPERTQPPLGSGGEALAGIA